MATHDERDAATLGDQAVALAEQLGRIAGTIEGTAEGLLNRQRIADQLTRVRDSASRMLQDLTARAKPKGRKAKKKPAKAMGAADPARAPGKRRRKPGPTLHGAKKSDLAIPKARTAAAARQRRKSYA
jgi:hypothetical protein